MATPQHPCSPEEHPDRCSCAPHEAVSRRPVASSGGAAWLLGGALAILCGGTSLQAVWRGDQGGQERVLGSNTEPSATIPTTRPDKGPLGAKLPSENEEDEALPAALPFDEYVARKALELRMRGFKCGHRVDLRVSFAPSGASTRAELVEPQVSAKVAQCVVTRLERTAIPAFRGSEERSVQVSLAMR
jgi:hypothetical protein